MSFAQTLRRPFQLLDRSLPDRLPPLTGKTLRVLRLLWLLAFALAVVGPLGGIYLHLSNPPRNSVLVPGSRAGLAVARADATQIRLSVGTVTTRAGVQSGDEIVAIGTQRLPDVMPMSGSIWSPELAEDSSDPAYQKMEKLLFGSAESDVRLTIRSPAGEMRSVTISTGEHHIEEEARRLGISPWLMSLIEVVHVVFYPLLLWVALVLHVRNPNQPVPTLLSFAILLMIGSEMPSSTFLSKIGVPLALEVALYDMANMALIAAVLLFPDGRLTPRNVLVPLLLLPVLFFLHGEAYQVTLLVVLVVAVTVFVKRLRASTGATRQQLKFLFVGLAGYPVFRTLSYLTDLQRLEGTASVAEMLVLHVAAGTLLALSIVALYFVLFSALRRHRLYDAEELFSRSAMVGALTLTITGFFAISSTILQSTSESVLGQDAGPWPSLVAAAAAVLLIKPAQRRIHAWAERRFQKGLFELRTELPKRMDDLRETASPATLLEDALKSIVTALRSTGAAAIVNGRVAAIVCVSTKEVREWLRSAQLDERAQLQFDRTDALFPFKLALRSGGGGGLPGGWILVGKRLDGSTYSRDERQALIEIQESVARAVEVARQRQETIASDRRWKTRQERRLQTLEDQLSRLLFDGASKGAGT